MAVQERLITVDEYEDFLALAQNDERYELIHGEIVAKVTTERHGIVSGNVYAALREFLKSWGLGRVVFEVRFRMPDDPHNTRIPDVSFTRTERLMPVVERGAVPQIPDLCIEVQSPDDTPREMRDKAAYYLANGAQLVWLIYTKKRQIEVMYPDGEFDLIREPELLTGGDLLPGFKMTFAEVFDES